MTGGGAVYDISTADAPPNSNLVLRIDNRTTVTITVNARQADICAPVTSSHASQERLDDTFLAGLNVPFAAVPRGAIDGAVATTRANTMADVPEPAGLLLFGTAIAALRWIKRRKR